MEECYPEVLYFYCNTEVFHNIIANKKLWLSDISKSNDALEQKYFAKLIIDNYDRIMCDIFNNHFDEREDDGVYEYLTKELVLDKGRFNRRSRGEVAPHRAKHESGMGQKKKKKKTGFRRRCRRSRV